MEKTSKVTQVTGNGTWDGQYGTMYKFEINFENGDSGQYMSKSKDQNKFVLGQEATYDLTSKEINGRTFYSVKPVQPQQLFVGKSSYQKDPETDKRITRMSVLKVAGDLVINGEVKIHDLTKFASILEHYVMTGEDSVSKMYSANDISSDLPF
jgi:hypothetical protein